MTSISLILSAFSIVYALIYISTQLHDPFYHSKVIARISGALLMVALAHLQWTHFHYLSGNTEGISGMSYLFSLYLVAPCFFIYTRPFLRDLDGVSYWDLVHLLPFVSIFALNFEKAFLGSFVFGVMYLLWLLSSLLALRSHRLNFKFEFSILSVTLLVALAVVFLGFSRSLISDQLFFSLYSSSIGVVFVALALVIHIKPKVAQNVREAAKETYQNSTLKNINVEQKIDALEDMMESSELYKQSNLDLHTISMELGLSSHQTSELINSQLGKSFSRYLRELRIHAAQELLIQKPKTAILDIAMEVGFSSQSNFYDAFKEIQGCTPSQYRKLNLHSANQ